MWCVQCENGEEFTSSYLIVATGLTQQLQNRELEETILKGLTGKLYHAGEIKGVTEEQRGERLLIVGGGETGGDLCTDFYDFCQYIYSDSTSSEKWPRLSHGENHRPLTRHHQC